MIARYLVVLFCVALAANTARGEAAANAKPLAGEYFFYSGGLGDMQQPNARDTKLFLSVSGDAGRELFDKLGVANRRNEKACDDPNTEIRRSGNLMCLGGSDGKYACYFGFDILTGKSIRSDIC